MRAKFYNKNGTLTAYSFACGYLEVYGNWLNGTGVRLGSCSGGGYEVRGQREDEDGTSKRIWENYEHVREARAFAKRFGPYNVPSDFQTADLPNLVTTDEEMTNELKQYLRSVQRSAIARGKTVYVWRTASGTLVSGLAHALPSYSLRVHAFNKDGIHTPMSLAPEAERTSK